MMPLLRSWWWVNGKRVGDTTATGNSGWPLQVTDHVFRAPLRQGRNLIGVRVISGSNSFTLRMGGGAEVRRERDAQRRWPEAPVPVSAVEGLIEGFWSSGLDAVSRWRSGAGELTTSSVNTHSILLRWVMLEKDGKVWTPPEKPFDGMIADGAGDAFEPGLDLIFGEPEPERMRQAARYAIALATIDEWSEGCVDRMPEVEWTHAGFAPNVATIKASLLLDWTWNWLTPEGREFVRGAIRDEGLKWLQGQENLMANQGIRFTKGLVLGHMAVADNVKDPALQAKVRAFLAKLNRKVDDVARPDGTFNEGMDYGQGTMASLPITYVAAGRCLDQTEEPSCRKPRTRRCLTCRSLSGNCSSITAALRTSTG